MSETPLLGLPIMEADQAQKHVTHNEALLLLDAAIHLSVVSRSLAAPPAAPGAGDRYLVAAAPTGAWSAQAGNLAIFQSGGWVFAVPRKGWRLWVEDEEAFLLFDGAAWRALGAGGGGSPGSLDMLGINATADTANRLTVSSPGVLFTNEGTDQRVKVNKHASADTASLVYQTGFSGRAELGLAGDDDFHVKVSPDGSVWNEGLVVDRTSGAVSLPNTAIGEAFASRAALAARLAAGMSRPAGTISHAGGLAYRWLPGATLLPGLPGLVPAGQATFRHFGAAGDGSTDDTTAIAAARGHPYSIDGEGLTYGVDGTINMLAGSWWENATFRQLSPASQTARTINANGVSGLRLIRIAVDKNGDGTNDGLLTGPNGAQSTSYTITVDGGQHHHLEDLEVYGNDSCSAIQLRNLDATSKVIRPYVHDMMTVLAGATDDVMRGLLVQLCNGLVIDNPRVERLSQRESSGGPDRWKFNKAIAVSGCTDLVLLAPRVSYCGQGIDFSGNLGSGNIDCRVISPMVTDCGVRGVKLANWTRRTLVLGGHVARSPDCGYVGTASWTSPVTDIEANWFIDCTAEDCGEDTAGFTVNNGAGAGEVNVPAKFLRCRAIDRRATPLMKYGFFDQVAWDGTARAELLEGCVVEGATKGNVRGFLARPVNEPANALGNPDFNSVDEWWLTSPNGDTGVVVVSDGQQETGYYAARFDNVSGVGCELQNQKLLPVAPGDTVHAAMRWKSSAGASMTNLRCRIAWLDKDGVTLSNTATSNLSAGSTSYTWSTVEGTAPANAVAAQLEIINTKTSGTVWIDRARLYRQTGTEALGNDVTTAGKAMLTAADAAAQTALLNTFTSALKGLAPASGGGTTNFLRADGTWAAPPGGGGVTDGDKGDITVSGSGTVWTIDNGTVSLAKMADMATASLIYRKTAGTGAPEVNTLATLKTDLGLSGTNSGDETASGILTKLLTVDGAGSGLDADTLDGFDSTAFARLSVANTFVSGQIVGSGSGNANQYLDGGAGSAKNFRMRSAGVDRWALQSDSTAESGGNAGSKFLIRAFDDSGVSLGDAVTITRASLDATFGGKVTLPATTTSKASLRLPHGTAPTSPTDGDVWTTTAGMYVRVNGTTVGPLGTGGGGSGVTRTVVSAAPATDQNDYSPSGYTSGTANDHVLRLNVGATMKITGVAAAADGGMVTLVNASTDYLLWLEHENTSSTAANRFTLPSAFPAFLMPGDTITLVYDGTSSRWRVQNWPNQRQAMGLTEFSDFAGQAPSSSGQALGPWGASFSGTSAGFSTSGTYGVNATEKVMGQVQASTGTTSTGRVFIGQESTDQIIQASGPSLAVSRVAVQAAANGTDTYTLACGFADEYNGAPVDGIFWEYRWNGSAVEWSQTALAASSYTRTTTGSPTPDLTYIWLIVFVNAAGTRADFIYSQDSAAFTKASSVTTGLPTNPTAFCAMSIRKSAGTTARLANIDLAGLRVDGQRG